MSSAPLLKLEPQSVQPSNSALAYEPQNLSEAMTLAKALFGSGLLPRTIKTQQDLLIIMMTGKELGLSTMQSVRSIWVLDGKPQLSADLLVGLVKRHRDVCEWFRVLEQTAERAVVETKRVGTPEPERFSYTLDDAKTAQLLGKDNWRKHPKDMLLARACARAARKVYPDLTANMYLPDELEDARQPERELNPPPKASPEASFSPEAVKMADEATKQAAPPKPAPPPITEPPPEPTPPPMPIPPPAPDAKATPMTSRQAIALQRPPATRAQLLTRARRLWFSMKEAGWNIEKFRGWAAGLLQADVPSASWTEAQLQILEDAAQAELSS